jgi:hypothetical protein
LNSGKLYGFFTTTLPFSRMQIGVPYIFAILRALRAAAGMARLTESKNRLFSAETLAIFVIPAQSTSRCFRNYHKSSMHQQSDDTHIEVIPTAPKTPNDNPAAIRSALTK